MGNKHPCALVTVPLGMTCGWLIGQMLQYVMDPSYAPGPISVVAPFIFALFALIIYMKISHYPY